MKKPVLIFPIVLAAGWLSTGIASAGSYSTDFSSYPSMTLSGSAPATWATDRVVLTPNTVSLTGGATVWDSVLDSGASVESFVVRFKLQLGPGSGNAADGTSFNFGANVDEINPTTEEGYGGACITVAFDIYDNGAAAEGHTTPSIDIRYQGRTIATAPFAKADMVTSQLEDVFIELKRSGCVSVSYKGQMVFTNVFVPGWAPATGFPPALFNWSARTGGESCNQAIDDLSITTVLVGAPVAASITADPVSVTVDEHGSATFGVTLGVDGSAPFSFQWIRNNVDVPDQTNATLTLANIPYTDNNAKYKVRVSNAVNTLTSGEATLTVNRDTVAPTVVKASPATSGTQLIVSFSEPVSDTAIALNNYRIDQGVTVSSVTRLAPDRVVLTTSAPMPEGRSFILTINGVQDLASSPANTIAANTQVQFRTVVFQLGVTIHKKYLSFDDGATYNSVFNDPRYPNAPDRQELMSMWEYPANGSARNAAADPARNYADTLEGYFIPPTTGDYVFITAGADNVYTFLSHDMDPANKHLISQVPGGWTNPRDWLVSQCGGTNGYSSDFLTPPEWPNVDPITGAAKITLTAGQKYYMETVHLDRSWSGADDFAVTYIMAGDPAPASGSAPKFTGNLIGAYLDPSGASVSFAQQPTNITILEGKTATFIAVATGQSAYGTNVAFQWQTAPSGSSTFTDITGSTGPSYTTPVAVQADSGKQYRVLATVPGFTEISSVATLTVLADTVAPKLVAAGALRNAGGSFDITVKFDETLTSGSATTLGNYTIPGLTVSAVKHVAPVNLVILTVSGLTVGNAYTLTVSGVSDPFNNAMASSSIQFSVFGMSWGAVGADELGLGAAVLPVASNGFDVYSDGIGEWANYDEATFVYEQITGNFDKEVRVEYQDPSSQWARAGLIARDVTNFGVDRATQATQAGRYQKVHANPVLTAMGTPGNNSFECNRRLTTGGATDSPAGGGVPAYPNAWVRLARTNQTFTMYRSSDGVTWTQLGTSTFDGTLPDTLYVGMDYSPENGNVTAGLRSVFLAKYRDYRTHGTVVAPPVMTYQRTATGLTITYEGTLESNSDLSNPNGWTPVTGATSPYPVTATAGPPMFYRAKR